MYGFVLNNPIFHFDVVGLWRSSEHRSITSSAWKNSGVSSDAAADRYIYTTIETFNVAVDDAPSANDMSQHFNRALNGDIDSARASYSANLESQKNWFNIFLDTPTKSKCNSALKRLGASDGVSPRMVTFHIL